MHALLQAIAVSTPAIAYDLSSLSASYTDKSSSDSSGNYGITFHIRVTTDGTIDVVRVHNSDTNDAETYITPANGKNLWVRCTNVSGTSINAGDSAGSWHTLTSSTARSFGLTYTASAGSPDLISSVIKIELARDSGGTDVVADSGNTSLEIGNVGP
jgi:hypothetical protein